jgi:hypothetical protein
MKKEKHGICLALAVFAFSVFTGCASAPELAGNWKEIGKTATLELSPDGTFKAVDNQKLPVGGKYSTDENGNIRFEIILSDDRSVMANGTYTLEGDILTVTSADGKEIQRYRRQK